MKKLMIKVLTTMFVLLALVGCSKEKSLDKQVLGCWQDTTSGRDAIMCLNKDKTVDYDIEIDADVYWELQGKTIVITKIRPDSSTYEERLRILDIDKNEMVL